MGKREYKMPKFLQEFIKEQKLYEKWLYRRAASQFLRDEKYYKKNDKSLNSTRAIYREKIHQAVIKSNGKDFYTGEELNWNKISTFGKKNGYKKIPDLPTVEHINRQKLNNKVEFVICSWEVNDMKNDLSYADFRELCKKVLEYKAGQNEQ